jgi:hypothetical protein
VSSGAKYGKQPHPLRSRSATYRVKADLLGRRPGSGWASEAKGFLRIVDESGEDYLFPGNLFVPIDVPAKAAPVFVAHASVIR